MTENKEFENGYNPYGNGSPDPNHMATPSLPEPQPELPIIIIIEEEPKKKKKSYSKPIKQLIKKMYNLLSW